jgi:hypothetical protein
MQFEGGCHGPALEDETLLEHHSSTLVNNFLEFIKDRCLLRELLKNEASFGNPLVDSKDRHGRHVC